MWTVPISASSERRTATCGWCRHMNPSDRTSSAASAASNASTTSAGWRVYGFSARTCLPAASACIVSGWWSEFGVAM